MICTSSWFTSLPEGHVRVAISRGTPRGASGHLAARRLAPGPWFRTVSPAEYLKRYLAILRDLDPHAVAAAITARAGDRVATLVCFEKPEDIAQGAAWCHRHIVAAWLEHHLGSPVPEVGFAYLDRWRAFREVGIAIPDFGSRAPRQTELNI